MGKGGSGSEYLLITRTCGRVSIPTALKVVHSVVTELLFILTLFLILYFDHYFTEF